MYRLKTSLSIYSHYIVLPCFPILSPILIPIQAYSMSQFRSMTPFPFLTVTSTTTNRTRGSHNPRPPTRHLLSAILVLASRYLRHCQPTFQPKQHNIEMPVQRQQRSSRRAARGKNKNKSIRQIRPHSPGKSSSSGTGKAR